ncbi:MAG: hypothetical protein AAF798_13720 [Bacteroidota bacterium]
MKKKNKTLNYVLIVLVLGIWGTIIYRVFTYGDDEQAVAYSNTNLALPELTTPTVLKATYTLKGDYDDPFLTGKKYRKSSAKSNSKSAFPKAKKATPKATAKVEEQPPVIVYKGFSLNNNEISRVKLQIAGKTYTLQQGESVQDVTVIAMDRNRVELKWRKEKLRIERN